MACSEQKYSLQRGYTTCEQTRNVAVLPSVTQGVNVRGDEGVWLLLAHSPLLRLRFSTMSLRSIINEVVCSWSIPHTNKILRFCREIWRLKQSAGSLSLYLPAPSRWERIHIFSWLSWPQEASRNSTQLPSAEQKQPHSLCECSSSTEFNDRQKKKKGKDNLTGGEMWQDIPNIFNTVCGENVLF